MRASSGDGDRTGGVSKWVWFAGLVVLLLGLSAVLSPSSPTPVTRSAPPVLERPVTLSGEDTGRTETFHLGGGAYRVEWKADPGETVLGRMCVASLGDPEMGVNVAQLFSADVQGRASGDNRA